MYDNSKKTPVAAAA